LNGAAGPRREGPKRARTVKLRFTVRSHTLPLTTLRVFLSVARRSSFSRAAEELGISVSAVSQAVRQLEASVGTPLVVRTTRSVSLSDAGRRLLEGTGPALEQVAAALEQATARPGELVGRLRLSVPRLAVALVMAPVLPLFLERYPRVAVDVSVDDRALDIVGQGYDAGIRLSEAIERDMVQVRLTGPQRFLVVGAPSYLARRGTPRRPEDLLRHECLCYRWPDTGAIYRWELERDSRSWRLPVQGAMSTDDAELLAILAEEGLGLAYLLESTVAGRLRRRTLRPVLEPYAPTVPGLFLYFPERSRRSPVLRAFIETARAAVRESTRSPVGSGSPSRNRVA
jgi:DNA-binding transcriptional LysR family regulator